MAVQTGLFSKSTSCYSLYNINLTHSTTDMTLIQLKFGPVVHCSKWYEDRVNDKSGTAYIQITIVSDVLLSTCQGIWIRILSRC